jgi:hypothetical protein
MTLKGFQAVKWLVLAQLIAGLVGCSDTSSSKKDAGSLGTDTGDGTGGDGDTDTDGDGDADTDTDGDGDTDTDTDTDGDTDTDTDTDADTTTDTGTAEDTGVDTEPDAGLDTETGTGDVEVGTDSDTGTGGNAEMCGDGMDNDQDSDVDCDDADCADAGPCRGRDTGWVTDGMTCAYGGDEPHPCACADGQDNDGDYDVDNYDLQCFGPYDDDESSFATGIPGDNNGDKGDIECPFDGNSGVGNDDVCCNPADPTTNVTPNGCDDQACCEIDVNGNSTGEFVYVLGGCEFAPDCGDDGNHGCDCDGPEDCDLGQFCVKDKNTGDGFCSTCEACVPNADCMNPCDCGEICFAGFRRPPVECGADGDTDVDTYIDTDSDTLPEDTDIVDTADTDVTDTNIVDTGGPTCPNDRTPCPGGDADCNADLYESCIGGCCYPQCQDGLQPCTVSTECNPGLVCITGCCIAFVI